MEWMRSGMTVIAFVTFVGIVLWAWSSRKKVDFDVAARSVLDEDETVATGRTLTASRGSRHE
jgi:cytochrome c oxidase cbb3-type subunit IV